MGLFLLLERRSVAKNAGRIPLRIAVTGTRGKSTVTRLIAASLREAGHSVMAKTTGSKPMIILPDGGEEEIVRRGLPTILEQKGVLRRAAETNVRALVLELMSVRPEILSVESRRLLRPHILVITNVRVDHREELGRTKPEIARGLASAISPGSAVFVLEDEFYPEFERALREAGAELMGVNRGGAPQAFPVSGPATHQPFAEDVALALAVSDHLGIPRETALRGIAGARPDFGSLRVWDVALGAPPVPWILVSAFAANEPESSGRALERLRDLPAAAGRDIVGVLSLREDRGDRTVQWIEALDRGFFSNFASLYVVGTHARARRWRRRSATAPAVRPVPGSSAEALIEKIVRDHPRGGVLVGLGNMGGLGARLVEHWDKIGRTHAL
jgi:poly-gamma-glutamate synthase PgsB/CapB